jgi:hypothetical protein
MNPLIIQSAKKGGDAGKPSPADVMKIADKCYVECHTDPGDFMSRSNLKLSNRDKYLLEKQAANAKAMCTLVNKDMMPPKGFRSKHPDDVPATRGLHVDVIVMGPHSRRLDEILPGSVTEQVFTILLSRSLSSLPKRKYE